MSSGGVSDGDWSDCRRERDGKPPQSKNSSRERSVGGSGGAGGAGTNGSGSGNAGGGGGGSGSTSSGGCAGGGGSGGLVKKKLGTEIGKAAAEKSRGLFSAEDWQCNKCANVNWARRQTCNMCNAPKFCDVEERTGYGGGYNDRGVVEYRDRSESDGEYDEFGRLKKRKKRENNSTRERRERKPSKNNSKIVRKDDNEDEDDEDDDDGDEDLSKYDLWGDDAELAPTASNTSAMNDPKNVTSTKKISRSPSRSKGCTARKKSNSNSRSRSSSSSSSSATTSSSSSSSTSSSSTTGSSHQSRTSRPPQQRQQRRRSSVDRDVRPNKPPISSSLRKQNTGKRYSRASISRSRSRSISRSPESPSKRKPRHGRDRKVNSSDSSYHHRRSRSRSNSAGRRRR